MEKNKSDGLVEDTKLLWALGNFSRFIRPGAQRISVTSEHIDVNNVNQFMISSYVNADSQNLVTVIINNGNVDSSVAIHTEGGQVRSWQPYITGPNEGETLKPLSPIDGDEVVVVPKKSIITLVGEMQ